MKKRILFLAFLSSISLIVSGCDNDSEINNQETKQRIVTKFLNYDDSILYVSTISYGENAVYGGETPTKPGNESTYYTFSGWDKSLESIKEDTTFYAQYTSETKKYLITFVNYNDEILDVDSFPGFVGVSPP